MKKKRHRWILITFLVTGILYAAYQAFVWTRYAHVIKINWNIEFPIWGCKEIYNIDSGPSFHGDGMRYHIFQYSNTDAISGAVPWAEQEGQSRHGKSFCAVTEEWLDELEVPTEYRPNYHVSDYYFYYDIQSDNSEIVIFFDEEEIKLYIVERFL